MAGLILSHGSALQATDRPVSHLAFHSQPLRHLPSPPTRIVGSCIHEQDICQMPCPAIHVSARGVAENSTSTQCGSVNVTSPKSLASACTITPGLLYTPTMKPCEVDANWICHQHVAPLSLEARSRSQASDPEPSTHKTPQSKLAYLTCVHTLGTVAHGGILRGLNIRCGRATLAVSTTNHLNDRDTAANIRASTCDCGDYAKPMVPLITTVNSCASYC